MKPQITAEQAFQLSSESFKPSSSPPENVISTINDRIHDACLDGRFRASLSSIDDDGYLVRGLGIYFSNDMLTRIQHYYTNFGFRFKTSSDTHKISDAWLEWVKVYI